MARIGGDAEAPPREPVTPPAVPATSRSSGSSTARWPASRSPFREHLAEVAIVIDDEPSPAQLRDNDLDPDDGLYGIYEGVPITEYGADWVALPNRITLFRLPLEEDFPDPDDLAEEVRITVIHELAHHLGIDDDRLGELGVD